MKPQTKPNPWSCIGTAFAMVLDVPVSDLYGIVGHDGSEIAFPALPDPMARRGFQPEGRPSQRRLRRTGPGSQRDGETQQPEKAQSDWLPSIAIQREIKRPFDSESVISVPDRTQRDARKENRQIKAPVVQQGIPQSCADRRQDVQQELMELRELLDSCCESDDERTILRMREEGYSDRQIADALGLSHTTTYMMRRELQRRFDDKCRSLEE